MPGDGVCVCVCACELMCFFDSMFVRIIMAVQGLCQHPSQVIHLKKQVQTERRLILPLKSALGG